MDDRFMGSAFLWERRAKIRFASCRADLAVAAGAIAAYGKEGEIGGLRGAWGQRRVRPAARLAGAVKNR